MKNENMKIKGKESSSTAEEMAIHRAVESTKPQNERAFYDPYAIRFLSPETRRFIDLIINGSKVARAKMDEMNRLFPGTQNSIIARVRYFDDFVQEAVHDGIKQLVILGAGYDSRAYRIPGVEELNVFEVDQPHTQQVKTRKIKEILGYLPSHVNYVPVNIGHDDLEQTLLKHGYDQSKKTLFTMEGFIYYFTPELVDEILSFMVRNSPPNSAFIFDYFPECVISGNCHLEVGNLMQHRVKNYGEPFKFGINPEDLPVFLTQRNFSLLENINSKIYGKAYFNDKREVCSIYSFASAVIK